MQLDHPSIVRTFGPGLANDIHFIVMEHLEGESLQAILEERKTLSPVEAAHWGPPRRLHRSHYAAYNYGGHPYSLYPGYGVAAYCYGYNRLW
jgi:hypothetical protein